jgi:hypothetical protein
MPAEQPSEEIRPAKRRRLGAEDRLAPVRIVPTEVRPPTDPPVLGRTWVLLLNERREEEETW